MLEKEEDPESKEKLADVRAAQAQARAQPRRAGVTSAIGRWLLSVGFWPLAFKRWLLIVGFWPLTVGVSGAGGGRGAAQQARGAEGADPADG
jgi:hypothetical protein